jgi:predicted DNA-binding transcriptional regulator YafY
MYKRSPLERLRQWLSAGEQLTYATIAARTQLGDKQISRLVRQLRAEGLPVTEARAGRHKVFALPAERQQVAVPDLVFDNAELRALAIAAKASRSALVGTPHLEALQRAFDRLLAHARPVTYLFDFDEPQKGWHFEQTPADAIAIECFRRLEEAMDEGQTVQIDYFTASKNTASQGRRIDPYFFAKRQRAWMLVAYCHQRQKPITFALTRISRVEPCPEEYFTLPDDLDPERFFRASLGAITEGETYELRLLVEAPQALYFRERLYHDTQQIEEQRPDGRLVVSYELEGLDDMRSFCQSWGTGLTVLAPPALRELLHREAEELAGRYRESHPPAHPSA